MARPLVGGSLGGGTISAETAELVPVVVVVMVEEEEEEAEADRAVVLMDEVVVLVGDWVKWLIFGDRSVRAVGR